MIGAFIDPRPSSPEWVSDCIHWYGAVLTGYGAHWCPEWDYMPIDVTCGEIVACSCHGSDPVIVQVQNTMSELTANDKEGK